MMRLTGIEEPFKNTYLTSSGNIGKRYRRSDVVGTPFAVTIDDNTLKDDTVTIRERDSMEQTVIKVSELEKYISDRIKF